MSEVRTAIEVMALKLTNLLRNVKRLSAVNVRQASQHYPIDEYIFGLSDEQIQVKLFVHRRQPKPIYFHCFLVEGYNFYFCPKRTGSLCS